MEPSQYRDLTALSSVQEATQVCRYEEVHLFHSHLRDTLYVKSKPLQHWALDLLIKTCTLHLRSFQYKYES